MNIKSLFIASCIFASGIMSATVSPLNEAHLKKSKHAIVKYSTANCQPCKQVAPLYHQVSRDVEFKNIAFMEVDVSGNMNLINTYNIRSAPTFIMFSNGKEVSRFTGSRTLNQLKNELRYWMHQEEEKAQKAQKRSASKSCAKNKPDKPKKA
jgi:thiol-disulfide isomerase/thioredoxin